MILEPKDVKLRRLIEDRESNVAEMARWTWSKTATHLDLIEQQLDWAMEQRNENAIDYLEEFRRQVISARDRKLQNQINRKTIS